MFHRLPDGFQRAAAEERHQTLRPGTQQQHAKYWSIFKRYVFFLFGWTVVDTVTAVQATQFWSKMNAGHPQAEANRRLGKAAEMAARKGNGAIHYPRILVMHCDSHA